jgi:hypothetical protein
MMSLVDVEHLLDRFLNRREIRVGFHVGRHHLPPAPDNRISRLSLGGWRVSLQICEQQ